MREFEKQYQTKKELAKNVQSNLYKDKIINIAFEFHSKGNIQEASKYYEIFIDQGFKDHRVFSNYGTILQLQGKLQKAELYYRQALELNPNYASAHANLGDILRTLGKLKEAEISTRKALELNPNFANAYSNLGSILMDLGNLQEAEFFQRKAIAINPNFANAYSNLGTILKDLGKLKEAEISTRKALELNPKLEIAFSNLGSILMDLGKLKEAECSYRKAIAINPNFADAYFNLFRYYEQINNLEYLKATLKEFNNVDIIKNELLLFRARLNFRNKEHKAAKELIDNISNLWIEKINKTQKIIFWTYKGFIEDKFGNYDIAYSCFQKSKEEILYSRFSKYAYFKYIDSYKKSIIIKGNDINYFNDGIEDSNLVFLVGFPRSGTTLLDTILRSHSDIEIIEEKPLIKNIEKFVQEKFKKQIDEISNLSNKDLTFLRNQYYELSKRYKTKNVKLFIDKLPLNTVCLPLINLLFPNAKIIFTHRHPYDTVLSCFQQSFEPNDAMANMMSIKSSSIIYDKVMESWDIYKKNLRLDFKTSKYEQLINNFDIHILNILEFLGVGWDKNLKNYRKTALDRGKINTPSSSQVVEPLYKTSIGKWENYKKYFVDCHQYLEKWVSYFDY